MDQDGTWHGGGPRSRPHCARWGLSSPPQIRGHSPQYTHISIVVKLLDASRCQVGMNVDLGPGHTVLDGTQLPSPKRGTAPPQFSADVWIKMALVAEFGLGPGHMRTQLNPSRGTAPANYRPCLLWPNDRLSHLLLSTRCSSVYRVFQFHSFSQSNWLPGRFCTPTLKRNFYKNETETLRHRTSNYISRES